MAPRLVIEVDLDGDVRSCTAGLLYVAPDEPEAQRAVFDRAVAELRLSYFGPEPAVPANEELRAATLALRNAQRRVAEERGHGRDFSAYLHKSLDAFGGGL